MVIIELVVLLFFIAIWSWKYMSELCKEDDFKNSTECNSDQKNNGTIVKTIIVPDEVDAKKSTRKSTQKEECKKYNVTENSIEKIVIKNGSKEKVTKIECAESYNVPKEDKYSNYDKGSCDPIQEKKSLLSKLFGPKDETDC